MQTTRRRIQRHAPTLRTLALCSLGLIFSFRPNLIAESPKPGAADQRQQAQRELQTLVKVLQLFKDLTGTYPTTKQGLKILVARPVEPEPAPPYWRALLENLPLDPWRSPYVYRYPSRTGKDVYELASLGSDRIESADDITLR